MNKNFFKLKEEFNNIDKLTGKYIIYNQYIDDKYYSTFRGKLLDFKNDTLYGTYKTIFFCRCEVLNYNK